MAGVVSCLLCGAKNRVAVAAAGRPRCGKCKADLPWLVNAGDADFDAAVATSLPVLVDLWAPWCGPCLMMSPGLEMAAKDLAGRLKVVKVNVDDAPETSARFEARSIPTLVILKDGKVIARKVGAMPAERLMSWARQALVSRSG